MQAAWACFYCQKSNNHPCGDLMRSAHTCQLWIVIVVGLLFSSVLAQDESRKERPGSASAADEAALRALAQEFYSAYAKKDLEGFLRLWSARAPELEARRQAMQ